MTYDEMYRDWKYLFKKVGCADDMTGGYVDSKDLDLLLKSPSKSTAKRCLSNQIDYWFDTGIQHDNSHKGKSIHDLIEVYPKIPEIADRHHVDINECRIPFCQKDY
tara:strand:- start:248 stop:565 length:318 start_codon:yes stop_codon:yes gene_type:complete